MNELDNNTSTRKKGKKQKNQPFHFSTDPFPVPVSLFLHIVAAVSGVLKIEIEMREIKEYKRVINVFPIISIWEQNCR